MSEFFEQLAEFFKLSGQRNVPDEYYDRIMQRVVSAPAYVDSGDVHYRASKIGRPFILQAVERWYGGKRSFTAGGVLSMVNGMLIQQVAAETLSLADIKFLQEERLTAHGIAGHADFIVQQGNDHVVIECKSMAPHLATKFRNEPTDDYGYLSQLAFYADTYRQRLAAEGSAATVVPAFLVFNRGTNQFTLMRIAEHVIESRVARYATVVPKLAVVSDYDIVGLLRVVQPPPVIGGKLPTVMTMTKWTNYLYECNDNWWQVRDTDDIIERFSELVAQRADRQPLSYRAVPGTDDGSNINPGVH
jgi:hypothetical protein